MGKSIKMRKKSSVKGQMRKLTKAKVQEARRQKRKQKTRKLKLMLKNNKLSQRPGGRPNTQQDLSDESDSGHVSDMIDDGDLTDFIMSTKLTSGQPTKLDEFERRYEENRKKNMKHTETLMKPLLPIKVDDKLIPVKMKLQEPMLEKVEDLGTATTKMKKEIQVISDDDLPGYLKKIVGAILSDPNGNIGKLRELVKTLKFGTRSVDGSKMVAIAATEVFKDILPDYRIRVLTDKERLHAMKKETKQLFSFEEELFNSYKAFIKILQNIVKRLPLPSATRSVLAKKTNLKLVTQTSVNCLCNLVKHNPDFNLSSDIITSLVPVMCSSSKTIKPIICNTIRDIFRQDRTGHISLDIVRTISQFLKKRNHNVPREMLDVFLALRIDHVTWQQQQNVPKKVEDRSKLSKKEHKRQKQLAKLDAELRKASAQEDKKVKLRTQSSIVEAMFLTYFRILKRAPTSDLVPSVLEGLAKFAHLINIEFFDDLLTTMSSLVDSENLSYRDSLHCIKTAFTILSGQGEALAIDPMKFYQHLYRSVLDFKPEDRVDDIASLLVCIDEMFHKRKKQIPLSRALLFVKRFATVSLYQDTPAAIALISACIQMMRSFPRADVLLETEATVDNFEGEHFCERSAEVCPLWELSLLKHHFDPVVSQLANELLLGKLSTSRQMDVRTICEQSVVSEWLGRFVTDQPVEGWTLKRGGNDDDDFAVEDIRTKTKKLRLEWR